MLMSSKRTSRKATVSLIFAIALIPLLMMVGLAIDFGFYGQAESQLDAAADSAALQAARIAVQMYAQENQGSDKANVQDALNKGQIAGRAWFEAQLANVPQAQSRIQPTIQMSFNAAANQITAQVNYAGVILTHFAKLFPASWPEYPNWGIAGAATAVISTLTYSEFDFVVDNSSSMLIAAGPTGIQAMEGLTPCSTQAKNMETTAPQPLAGTSLVNSGYAESYSWYYDPNGAPDNNSAYKAPNSNTPIPYGYGIFSYQDNNKKIQQTNYIKPPITKTGECAPEFSTSAMAGGYGSECFYVPGQTTAVRNPLINPQIDPTTRLCKTGGGAAPFLNTKNEIYTQQNVPQAPCAFACHTDASNNDYYGLARANTVTLRFDVIQQALTATQSEKSQPLGVIPTLENYVQNTGSLNPVTVGFYYFNNKFHPEVSPSPGRNSLVALQNAEDAELKVEPAIVSDIADTNTPGALTNMYGIYSNAPNGGAVGNGNLPSAPKKYMFLITDGLEDFFNDQGQRKQGPLGTVTLGGTNSLQQCQAIKNLGVKIFILYTTYYPLPNPYYIDNDLTSVEPVGPSSRVYQALQQCASPGTTSNPTILEASDTSDIGIALNKLVESALSAPGRLSD